jgi:Fe-S oxidoreductase
LAVDDDPGECSLIVLPDVFTAIIEPQVLEATIKLLVGAGERPAVGPYVPTGKLDHIKGDRTRFATSVAAQRLVVEKLSRHGLPLLIIEPAIFLLHGYEYPSIDPTFPTSAVTSAGEFLDRRVDAFPSQARRGRAQLMGHCTEISLAPAHTGQYQRLLERAGFDVSIETTTCCGMAGIFGHEAENQAMSRSLFDSFWRPLLEREGPSERCAPGYSCRAQSKRLDGAELTHPYVVAARAFGYH